jgi:transcriptional regulator of arginine metabolism
VTRPGGRVIGERAPAPPDPAGPAGPVHSVNPVTKAARHAQITAILAQPGAPVRSQDELAERLGQRGVRVTQATLSRDLDELGAVRLRGRDGGLFYALPGAADLGAGGPGAGVPGAGGPGAEPSGRLARVAQELLLAAEASANLVVLRTPAGAAQLLASAIDQASWPAILGTVGGDDTILVIARDPAGGEELAGALLRLAERRPRHQPPAPGHDPITP